MKLATACGGSAPCLVHGLVPLSSSSVALSLLLGHQPHGGGLQRLAASSCVSRGAVWSRALEINVSPEPCQAGPQAHVTALLTKALKEAEESFHGLLQSVSKGCF